MQIFVFDTNIVLHLVRGKQMAKTIKDYLNEQDEQQYLISVASIAEAESLVKQAANWSVKKIEALKKLLSQFVIIGIESNNRILIDCYTDIDAFSQGKTAAPDGKMLNNTPRNMGKNDIWIAATTYALGATLLTTDKDFDHLHQLFFEVKRF